MPDDVYIQKLRALKPNFPNWKIKSVKVFGSRLKGTARPDSDLDLLIEFEKRPDLLELGDLYVTLEDKLGCRVDIVQPHKIYPALKASILNEARDV
jgi:predicted nucleotidyltransferase